jgi:hypothetical protein
LPGDDANDASTSAPAVSANVSVRTSRFVANEAPLAWRHWVQWQWYIASGAPSMR